MLHCSAPVQRPSLSVDPVFFFVLYTLVDYESTAASAPSSQWQSMVTMVSLVYGLPTLWPPHLEDERPQHLSSLSLLKIFFKLATIERHEDALMQVYCWERYSLHCAACILRNKL